ncbi:hypothetical protein VTP01DRAFT_2856 [Rhizomucor pusillus]|uniref:uncharacterized protein n=1 Tax=Rhizomucor pusillus TaxID=4840 RepID=UPI003743ADF2
MCSTVTSCSPSSPPVSPSSSSSPAAINLTNKKVIDGRVYHDRADVTYIMPEDDEDKDRLHQQHWMIRLAFGSNFDAPVQDALERGIVVLDSACGPATWTLEMAQQYPHSTFHGIDIAEQFPNEIKPFNCHFQVANVTEKLPFPDNYFDYIHQRLLVAALTRDGWNNCLSELFRVLKPGGWLELKEVDVEVASRVGPPTMVHLMQILANLVKSRGMVPGIGAELPELLQTYKFQDIRARTVGIAALDGTKLGELAWEDFVTAFEGLKPILQRMYPDKFGTKDQMERSLVFYMCNKALPLDAGEQNCNIL